MACSRGLWTTQVFANSLNAITLLKDGCSTTHPQQTLTENIHQIHNDIGEVNWKHIFRKANQVVDDLVKYVFGQQC